MTASGEYTVLHHGEHPDPPEMVLHAISTRPATALVAGLMQAVDEACGWVQDRQMVSSSTMQVRVEAQGRAMVDLYAAFLIAGLELSRASHQLLMERCTCARLQRASRSCIVSLRLNILLESEIPHVPRCSRGGHA